MDTLLLRFMCIMICIGLFLVFRGNILYLFKSISWPMLQRREYESRIRKHLRQIFQVVTNGKHINEKIFIFILISIAVLVGMGIVMVRPFKFNGIVIATIMAAMPYGYIRAKLALKQVAGSFEGEILVAELINQYKMCSKNIYETIDKSVLELNDSTLSKKALFQLRLKLNSYTKESELREAFNDFAANWNTIWARMLADNLYNAVKEEVNILPGLENIMEQGKRVNQTIEENKKDGMETEVMVKILFPLFSLLMLFLARNMVGYPWNRILSYLFIEPIGLILISVYIFLWGLNLVILPVLNKQKYDF